MGINAHDDFDPPQPPGPLEFALNEYVELDIGGGEGAARYTFQQDGRFKGQGLPKGFSPTGPRCVSTTVVQFSQPYDFTNPSVKKCSINQVLGEVGPYGNKPLGSVRFNQLGVNTFEINAGMYGDEIIVPGITPQDLVDGQPHTITVDVTNDAVAGLYTLIVSVDGAQVGPTIQNPYAGHGEPQMVRHGHYLHGLTGWWIQYLSATATD